MKVYRCRICGETYLGEEAPDKCPFCGVARGFLVEAEKWKNENADLELSEISKNNIYSAIEIEVSNTRFYLAAATSALGKDKVLEAMFKRLSKVEREHASLLCKMVGDNLPTEVDESSGCSANGIENVEESSTRETRAVELYGKFLAEAKEERVKTVFGALVNTEKTHLELDAIQENRLVKG